MENIVKNYLRENACLAEHKIVLAVSGGLDSMVLWRLFHQLKLDYVVAHVNFQLRGEDSKADENLVRETANQRNVPFYLLEANTTKIAKEKGISIQMAAREIRYDWFKELMQKNKLDFLATAHHLNDSIETFFINLDRGTGIKGLVGIGSQESLLRPLISFTREELNEYAEENNIVYREDLSNANTKYQRNWFRHTILKEWKTRNPAFEKTMAKNLAHFSTAEKVYQKAIESDLRVIVKELKGGYFSIKNYTDLTFQEESLFVLLSPYGFSETQIQNLKHGMENHQVGLQFYSSEYVLNLDRERVYIQKNELQDKIEEAFIHQYQNHLETPLSLNFNLILKRDIIFEKEDKQAFLDFEKLVFPLHLRTWQKGDKMKPLGMKGHKKISDILIDLKVPLIEKDSIWVLLSNQKIVWLVGYKTSEEFKVEKETKQVLKIEL